MILMQSLVGHMDLAFFVWWWKKADKQGAKRSLGELKGWGLRRSKTKGGKCNCQKQKAALWLLIDFWPKVDDVHSIIPRK